MCKILHYYAITNVAYSKLAHLESSTRGPGADAALRGGLREGDGVVNRCTAAAGERGAEELSSPAVWLRCEDLVVNRYRAATRERQEAMGHDTLGHKF